MRCWLSILACAATFGCTASNPSYIGGNGGSGGVGGSGGPSADMAAGGGGGMGPHDMAVLQPDLAGAMCTGDQRACVQVPTPMSVMCSSGMFTRDRVCPFGNVNGSGASCSKGYCQPPTTNGTTSCATGGPLEQICDQMGGGTTHPYSCQPFITNPSTPTVDWWCAIAANRGSGVAGTSCTKDSDCRTGFCGSNGTCFWACQTTGDCLSATLQCKQVTILVEHVTVTATSCIP